MINFLDHIFINLKYFLKKMLEWFKFFIIMIIWVLTNKNTNLIILSKPPLVNMLKLLIQKDYQLFILKESLIYDFSLFFNFTY